METSPFLFLKDSKLYLLDQNAPLSNPRTNIHLFVSTCVEFIGYTFTIALAAMIWKREYSKQILLDMLTLVTLSSFGYLFSILIIVWKYPIHFLSILQCFGFTSTCVALLGSSSSNNSFSLPFNQDQLDRYQMRSISKWEANLKPYVDQSSLSPMLPRFVNFDCFFGLGYWVYCLSHMCLAWLPKHSSYDINWTIWCS